MRAWDRWPKAEQSKNLRSTAQQHFLQLCQQPAAITAFHGFSPVPVASSWNGKFRKCGVAETVLSPLCGWLLPTLDPPPVVQWFAKLISTIWAPTNLELPGRLSLSPSLFHTPLGATTASTVSPVLRKSAAITSTWSRMLQSPAPPPAPNR